MGRIVNSQISWLLKVARSCPLALLTPGLLLGQYCYTWSSNFDELTLVALCAFALRCRRRVKVLVVIPIIGALFGWLSISVHGMNQELSLPKAEIFSVVVGAQIDYSNAGSIRFGGYVLGEQGRPIYALFDGAYLPWRELSAVTPGAYFLLQAKCSAITSTLASSGWAARLKRQGYSHQCKIQRASYQGEIGRASLSILREKITQKILELDSPVSGVLLAMTLGEKSFLAREDRQALTEVGLGHLLVVSGYHVGLFYGICLQILFFLLYPLRKLYWKLQIVSLARWLSLFLSFGYVLLTGSGLSALRAFIVLIVLCVQAGLSSPTSMLHRLVTSFAIISILWPFSFLEVGVQLSYAALLGIACALKLSQKRGMILSYIFVSAGATSFSGLVAYLHFGQVAPLALFYNILFAPILSIIGCAGGLCAEVLWLLGLDPGYGLSLVLSALEFFISLIR